MSIRALILDYGEVLSLPQPADALAGMAAAAQAAAQPFADAYWRYRGDYDRGMPATEYWQSVLADARAASRQADDIERLIALDVRSWTGYREEVWTLAEQQRAAGVRTAVLSNGVPEIMEVIERERAISTKFDTVVVSYEVGCAKPDAEIFELTLDRLGVAAAHALFVDDREVNLEGARRVGLRTLHFTGPYAVDSLRAALRY
jgi:putative hydrolase of the HAD superfamily